MNYKYIYISSLNNIYVYIYSIDCRNAPNKPCLSLCPSVRTSVCVHDNSSKNRDILMKVKRLFRKR